MQQPVTPPPTVEAQAWLDAQNAVRQNAKPVPSPPLPALTWSADAAAVATAWAQHCVYQHNANRGARGENIAANAPVGSWSLQGVVNAWAGEAADYDYATNSGNAGHYTQVVWRDSVRIGCAIVDCPALTYHNTVICDYAPGGNISGQKPY